MSIVLWDNIEYKGKKPLDSRMLFDTIADMKAYSENYLPDITLAFNKEDSKMYVFNRENDVDEDTGKWRIFDSVSGEEDKANIIDGTEIKDLFGGTEEDIKIKTITDEIENDKAPLRNKEWAFRANVGYFTPVDQVGIQGKNIYSINLWDGRAWDIDVYAVNVGVTSGILTLNQFPADLSAYEAASSKICTLHLLGDGQHRRFVLDGTDSNVTDINEDFVNEAGYVEIPTWYFLSFKDYSASWTGWVLYGGVEGMGREVGFCYFDDNATRQLWPGNLAVGVSTVTETEGTGTAYAFDTYLRDEENNTLRSKEIEEAKKSVDNLFNVETVSTVKIWPGVDQASFTSRNQAYGQTSTSWPFIMYDQRGIQGKKLYSIWIGCNTNTKGGAIDINIAHLNNTGEVLTKASFPTNVEDFLPLCERLCTVTFPTNDGNNFYTFKLDGTDSRVSNINSNYVGDDGYIEIPVGYYIGLKTWNTNNAPAFTYSWTIDVNNPYAIGWAYYTSDGTTGTIAENTTAMLWLQFNIIEWAEQKHYNFDDKLVTTIKHEEHIDFAPSCETAGTKWLSATNYFLWNRLFFPMWSYNIEQYSMNGKYLRGVSYVGAANTSVYFVLAHVEDNTIDYTGATNSDCYSISTGTPENNYNGKALFKITPDANVDTSKPTIYKLDGTDSRVTILNTDLYDSEEGGFLFDKTWLVGINSMGFTNTNNTTPDGTYPAKYLTGAWYWFLAYNTTSPSVDTTFTKTVNNSLIITFYTDIDNITYEEQINSKVIADLKEKVDNIDMTEVESPLKGKYISLIWDSISTYQGWSNVAPLSTSAAVYYPRGDVSNVNYTYWKMLVDRTGANLLVNNSWSGSTLCSQGTAPVIGTGANDRCHQLDKDGHLPDYIIINIGTNDFDRSFGLGTWNGRGEDFPANASTATATTFREAYAIMLARLQEYYPLAKIYCCTFPCGNRLARGINERNTNGVYLVEFNDAIREIATAFGCRVIDLASSGLNYRTLQTLFCDYNASSQSGEGDALHPNIAGMERFYELIRGAMEGESSNTSAATRKKLVDLRDVEITSPVTGQWIIYDAVAGKWINGKASDVLTFKWSVADYASLPSSDQEVGDVWNCLDNNKNYVWTGTAWDEFSSSYTFSNVDVKNSWVKQLYGLTSGSISDFIVGDSNGGTTMKVKRGVGECVADFMTINLTGVGRGKYVTIKVKNNNVDYVTDVMNYMEFWGCGNTNFDWSWTWWILGSFDTIKREAVFVIDTDKEFQDITSGSTTRTWANVIQFNTRRFYQSWQKKLQALSADFEVSVYIQTKETKASNIVVADTADSAKDAGHAELAHMVGVKPLTGVNAESWWAANKWPNTPTGIFSTTLIGGSKIRMNIASFTKDESTNQYYYVYSRPVKKYLNKWYKFFVRVNQTSPSVSGSSVAINEFHFSTQRDVWGSAVAMNHSITPSLATVRGMTSYVAEITPNQYTWSASEVYFQVAAFTNIAWTYSANTCDVEVFVTEPDYFLPYNTYSMVSKSEMDAAISAAADSYQNCITFWWDSLTAWGGWTTRLCTLSGMTERNGGTWGENARTIVARQGADVMMINNKTIPASGAVTLYTRSGDVGIPTQEWYKVTPLLQGGSHVNPVKIGDITGTLAWTGSSYADQNGTWTFTRSTAGSEVTIDRPTAMTTNFDRTYNNPHLMVIFIGQNGWYSDLDDLVRQHRLMIDHAKAKHYIVLWLSSGSATQRADYETRMKKEFGRYFISLREYLSTPIYENGNIVSCYGMADQNVEIDPTFTYDGKTTVQEIEAGICPHQILADSVHYTSWTKTVIGNYLYKKCKELWIF